MKLRFELDNLSSDERKIDSSVYAAADGDDRVILADLVAAPTALRLKLPGTPCEQKLGLATAPGSKQLPELAHWQIVPQEKDATYVPDTSLDLPTGCPASEVR